MKTIPLPERFKNPQPINDRKQLIECLEAVLMVIALECRPSEAGKDVVRQAKEVLSKAKGQQ